MIIINYFKLKKLIINYGISKKNSKEIIKDIRKIDPELKKLFAAWFKTGKTPECFVEGVSFDMLVKTFRMNPVNAFLTLDWLKREPKKAKRALSGGFDKIIVNTASLSENEVSENEDTSDIEVEE